MHRPDWLPLLAAFTAAGIGTAQEGEPEAAPTRTITVQNLAPFPRRDWAGAVIPFARGAVAKLPDLHAGKGPTVWQPIGARWPDGSLRQALCLFPIAMAGVSEVVLPLEPGTGAPLPALPIRDPLRDGSARIEIAITVGGTTTTARPAFVRELEANDARRVALYRCRVGTTGLVFELILAAWRGCEHSDVHAGLFFSDPGIKATGARVGRAVLTTRGLRLVLRHAQAFGISTRILEDGTEVVLLRDVPVGDGQGIRRSGVLAPLPVRRDDPGNDRGDRRDDRGDDLGEHTFQAAAVAPLVAATDWRASGAYGPFGFVPDPPPWLQGARGRAALARRHRAFVATMRTPGHPFRRLPFMLLKDPGATGDQPDFGILKLAPVASTGIPSFLLEVEPSILQEACRPVHFFEADGSPVLSREHPDWVTWNGVTHWNGNVSKDRLGKPCPPAPFENHGWRGKDRQHWSSNYLCGYYLLTGSHAARREIDNEVQLFLAGQTVRDLPTSGTGAARAVGRVLLAGCWLYQCTGDPALLQRIRERLARVYLPGWAGRDLAPDRVRPMVVRGPDGHVLGGAVRYWIPWEESIAATGLYAAHRLTGDAATGRLAGEIALNVLRHGWLVSDQGASVGYRFRFQEGGEPLSDDQMQARAATVCVYGGGGLSMWSIGAVEIAHHFAQARGDAAMVSKAERILAALRSGQDRPPRNGWWDPLRDWDAVRPGR